MKDYFKYVPKILKDNLIPYLFFTENQIVENETLCVEFEKNKFHIDINTKFFDSQTEDMKEKLILHELFHIFRQDLLIEKTYDYELMNIATDSIINYQLDILDKDFWHYNEFKEKYPELPEKPITWLDIYNILKKENNLNKKISLIFYPITDEEKKNEAKKIIAEISLILSACGYISLNPTPITPEYTKIKLPKTLANKFENLIGTYIIKRKVKSWRKSRNNLKTYSYRYMPSFTFFIDVSGSMIDYKKQIFGLIKYLKTVGYIDVYIFSDNIKRVKNLRNFEFFGGGTQANKVFQLINEKKLKNIVIISDFIFDRSYRKNYMKKKILITFKSQKQLAEKQANSIDKILFLEEKNENN